MSRSAVEIGVFAGASIALHLALLAVFAAPEPQAAPGGGGGGAVIVPSDAALSALVEAWETPPATAEAPGQLATLTAEDAPDLADGSALPDPAPAPPVETAAPAAPPGEATRPAAVPQPLRQTAKAPPPAPAPPAPRSADRAPAPMAAPLDLAMSGLATPELARPAAPAPATMPLPPPQAPPEETAELAPDRAPKPATRPKEAPPRAAAAARRPPAEAKPAARPRPARLPAEPAAAPAANPAPAAPAAPSGPAPGTGPTEGADSDATRQARLSYGARIRAAIQAQRRYPRRARQRREEGTVRLRLTVARDGRLVSGRISGSSGHERLDEAALAALRSAGRFPAAPDDLRGAEFTFVIPIQFRLR